MARTSITEAAAQLGVSVDSIRRRLRSGALPGVRDNRGQWWLDLPDNMSPEAATPSVEERLVSAMLAPAQQPMQPPDTSLVDALRDQVADLTGRLDRMEARAEKAEAQGAADREAAAAREAELRTSAERQGRELTAALLRTAIAETEAKAAREAKDEAQRMLAAVRQPFWRRWLG